MSGNNVYWHYTNYEGAKGIKTSGLIRASNGYGDAAFGVGVYLTQMGTSESKDDILLNNFDDLATNFPNRADYYVKLTLTPAGQARIIVPHTRRDVHLFNDHIGLNLNDAALVVGSAPIRKKRVAAVNQVPMQMPAQF